MKNRLVLWTAELGKESKIGFETDPRSTTPTQINIKFEVHTKIIATLQIQGTQYWKLENYPYATCYKKSLIVYWSFYGTYIDNCGKLLSTHLGFNDAKLSDKRTNRKTILTIYGKVISWKSTKF